MKKLGIHILTGLLVISLVTHAAEPFGEMTKNPLSLSQDRLAKASTEWGLGYEADKAFDGDETSRWGAKPESRAGWIEVDLGADTTVGRAVVMEIGYPRTRKFSIQYRNGDAWNAAVTGGAIAGRHAYDFTPVKARYFRLNILVADEVPTIEEFQLYAPGAELPASPALYPQIIAYHSS